MIKVTPGKHILVTNSRKDMLGLVGRDWFKKFFNTPGALMFSGRHMVEVFPRYMSQVDSTEECEHIIYNIKKSIEECKNNILEIKDKIRIREEDISNISSLDLIKSSNSSLYYREVYNREEKILKRGYYSSGVSLDDLIIRDNQIWIPDKSEPFYYNTDDDLLQVEIGDILELKFKDHQKVKKDYRGKTIRFVVNNFLEYKYRNRTRRLALTPIIDGWTKKDIVILDDSDRFECLMIDLFPCNRRPFAGWRRKNVSVKKIGSASSLPGYKNDIDFKKLLDTNPGDYIISYLHEDHTISDIIRYEDSKGLFWTCKLATSSDANKAIRFIKSRIREYKKKIVEIEECIERNEETIAAYYDYGYEKLFDEVPYEEEPEVPEDKPIEPLDITTIKEIRVEKDNKGYYGIEYACRTSSEGTIEEVATYSDMRRFPSEKEAYDRFSIILQHLEKVCIHTV